MERCKRITFGAGTTDYMDALRELEREGLFVIAEDGVLLTAQNAEEPAIECDGKTARIFCADGPQFFRMLSYLLQKDEGEAFSVHERVLYMRSGAMLDSSRNGVISPEAFRFYVRRMALMGLTTVMLYTEDTYTVPEYPFFGYGRGSYTFEEMRGMDDYAAMFGIEVVPCIQALGHLEKVLRWPAMAQLRDSASVLITKTPATRAFLEASIRAASAPVRSRRIHLGMDEAYGMGVGRALAERGYQKPVEIMRNHLQDVLEICRTLGLQPMIWSDMCLRPLSKSDDYYDLTLTDEEIPQEVRMSVPSEMPLVYWDYYHSEEQEYETLFRRHELFPNPLVFAGGAWTWNGIAPNYGKMFTTTNAALTVCGRHNVREILCTAWSDNGAETSMYTILPALQLYGEFAYGADTGKENVFERFAVCCGAKAEDFYALRLFDEVPGVTPNNPMESNPSKYLLYQDPLGGLYDLYAEYPALEQWYEKLQAEMERAAERNPRYEKMFAFYAKLAAVLAKKACLGGRIRQAYADENRELLRDCCEVAKRLPGMVDELRDAWEETWMQNNKRPGFEVIDMRLGALNARAKNCVRRIEGYLAGRIEKIDELEQPQLWLDGKDRSQVEEKHLRAELWDEIVSVNPVSMI